MTKHLFEIKAVELETIIKLYLVKNPYQTPARLYARWKCGKLKLLIDYKVWNKGDFLALFENKNDEK
jgi:hypothetical protein